jgi:hypothetical protein
VAFVDWLNRLTHTDPPIINAGVTFRVPTGAEIAAVRFSRRVWVREGEALRVRQPSGRRDGFAAEALTDAVAADLDDSQLLGHLLGNQAVRTVTMILRHADAVNESAAPLPDDTMALANFTTPGDHAGQAQLFSAQATAARNIARLRDEILDLAQAVSLVQNIFLKGPWLAAATLVDLRADMNGISLVPATHAVDMASRHPNTTSGLAEARIELNRCLVALSACRRRLQELSPVLAQRSPIDRILGSIGDQLAKSRQEFRADEDPARTIATVLVPYRADRDNRFRVDLDGLAAKVARIPERLAGLAVGDEVVEALNRLLQVTTPVVNRRELITPAAAAAIRAPSLVLARISYQAGDNGLANALIELAAAACVLEERRRSPDLLETLVLAHD